MDFEHKTINKLMEQEYGMKIQALNLFCDNWKDVSQLKNRNAFVSVCRKLTSHHQFTPILDFVYDVFCTRAGKDLMFLKELLSEVDIERNVSIPYTLADLSQDYLISILRMKGTAVPDGIDLFRDCPDNVFRGRGWRPEYLEIQNALFLRNIYGVYAPEFCEEDVDVMVTIVRDRAEQAHRKECEEIDADNAECSAYGRLDKQIYPEFAEFERDLAIPGMLLPFLKVAEKCEDKQELCFYMLEKYVFPTLEVTPWEQEGNPDVRMIAQAVRIYADELQALQYRPIPRTEDVYSSEDEEYVKEVLYYEALGRGDPGQYRYTDSNAVEYARRHGESFRQWASILHRGGSMLKQALRPQGYSFHMLNTAFMLYLSGQTEDACWFLLQHYGDIGEYEKCKPHLQILLARTILSADRLETVNALYGTFSYEMDRVYRDKAQVLDLTRQMVRFLRDARSYILESNEYAFKENISWFDILFKDGRIDRLLEQCEEVLREGNILDYGLFRKLAIHVEAFSDRAGVNLNKLGLGRYDYEDYDHLEDALSEQLRLLGERCMAQVGDAKVFYARRAQYDILRSIDLHLQNHTTKLQMDGVKEKLEQVNRVKEQKLTEKMEEKACEELLREIEDITEKLVDTAKGSYLWRPEVERDIHKLRQEFEEKYADVLGRDVDLMGKLSKEVWDQVHNYLVTSNMVFRMMDRQHDSKLDFSAALISMTKALELVMLQVYHKSNVKIYNDMEDKDKSHYFFFTKKGPVKKENQTLQSCIEILKDEKRIKAWGVRKVLNLSLLEKFEELRTLDLYKLDGLDDSDYYCNQRRAVRKGTPMFYISTLRLALTHVCRKYRNSTAHAEFIELDQVKECREMLLMGERLLWILLAIMK